MEIVGEVTGHVELLVAVRETQANVVIAGIDPGRDEGMLTHLFAEYPDLTVLVIRPSGTVCIEQRCRCRVEIDDLSPVRLAEMLRSAIRHSR